MTKNKPMLVRVPEAIKRELERQAKEESRSLSAHVLHLLKRTMAANVVKEKGA